MKETQNVGWISRMLEGFHWENTPDIPYKPSGDSFSGVRRVNLAGMRGEKTKFHLRYFEIEKNGFTTRERHQHEHVVVVLRGAGEVFLENRWLDLQFGDVAYLPPQAVHYLRNRNDEPFGFLCIVDAQRDRPVPMPEETQ